MEGQGNNERNEYGKESINNKTQSLKGMQELNVIIKLPFKRPSNFIAVDKLTWTEEKEKILWDFLNSGLKESVDWLNVSEKLEVPVSQVIKHSSILYEKKLKDIKKQISIRADLQDIDFPKSAQKDSPESVGTLKQLKNKISSEDEHKTNIDHLTKALSGLDVDNIKTNSKSKIKNAMDIETRNEVIVHNSTERTVNNNEELSKRDSPIEIDSPYSELSEGSIDKPKEENYISMLKSSALSFFK